MNAMRDLYILILGFRRMLNFRFCKIWDRQNRIHQVVLFRVPV
jgi:hypothetical protein